MPVVVVAVVDALSLVLVPLAAVGGGRLLVFLMARAMFWLKRTLN